MELNTGWIILMVVLILAFLAWAIAVTVLRYKEKQECDRIPTSISGEKEVVLGPGPIIRSGEYSLVLQSDGNLVIFKKPKDSASTIVAKTEGQSWNKGLLVYDKDTNITSLSFMNSQNAQATTMQWQAGPWDTWKQSAILEFSKEGILQLRGKDDDQVKVINLSEVTPGAGNSGSFSRM